MGQLQQLASQTAIYGASSIIGRLLNYLLVPFYTAVFEPAQFGIMSVLSGYAVFLLIVFTYGLETTYFRFSTKTEADKKQVYGQVMTMIIFSTLGLGGLIYIFADPIAQAIQFAGLGRMIQWIALSIAIDAILSVPYARLRLEGKPVKFASIKLLNIFTNIALNLFFLWIAPQAINGEGFGFLVPLISSWYIPDLGVEYIFISNFLAGLVQIPFFLRELSGFKFTWSNPLVRNMLYYSLPIAIMGLAGSVNDTFSRLMIKYLVPAEEANYAAGVFGACYKLSIFMNLCIQAFRYAAEPFFFSNAAEKNSPQLFSRVMKWFVIFGSIVFIAISLNLSWIGLLLRQPEYREALFIVPVLLMGYLFFGIYYNLSVWYKLTDKTYYGAYMSGIGAIITITGTFVLIPLAGYFGAALATLLAFVVMAVLSYYLGEKHYPIPYEVSNAVFYILSSAGIVMAINQVAFDNFFIELLVKNLLAISFICLVLFKERRNLPLPKRFIS